MMAPSWLSHATAARFWASTASDAPRGCSATTTVGPHEGSAPLAGATATTWAEKAKAPAERNNTDGSTIMERTS